jgi:hypothetical protein
VVISDLVLGKPQIRFSDHQQDSAVVEMTIPSGKYELQKNERTKQGTIKSGSLKSIVGLTKVHGRAGTGTLMSVEIDLSASAFETIELELQLDESGTAELRRELALHLTKYFKTHEFVYWLGAVDLSDQPGLIPALRPHDFFIRTVIRDSEHAWLELFVNTDANAPGGGAPVRRGATSDMHLDVKVAVPAGYDCCLMISSMLFFRDILAHEMPYKLSATPVKSTITDQSKLMWHAVVGDTSIQSGNFDIGADDIRVGPTAGKGNIAVNLSGATIAGSTDPKNGLTFALEKKSWKVDFEQKERRCVRWTVIPGSGGDLACADWRDFWNQIDFVEVTFGVSFPIALSTKQSQVQLQAGGQTNSFTITADARLPKDCPKEQDKLRQRLKTAVDANLPGKFKEVVNNTKFSAVSVFALENLVFPGENHIELAATYVPGDLVILGKIKSAD